MSITSKILAEIDQTGVSLNNAEASISIERTNNVSSLVLRYVLS